MRNTYVGNAADIITFELRVVKLVYGHLQILCGFEFNETIMISVWIRNNP